MTIDAAEISRLRDYVKNGGRLHGDKAISLLDELEKARGESQRQYDYNVGQIAKYAALEAELEKARELNEKAHVALGITRDQRDSARALLREAQGRFINLRDAIRSSVAKTVGVQICEEQIVRIAAELGDKP